jgi:hypothetical protein
MESSVSIISHSHISMQALKIEIGYFVTWEGRERERRCDTEQHPTRLSRDILWSEYVQQDIFSHSRNLLWMNL